MGRRATGIIWMGPVFQATGYGAVSRNGVLGLARIGFPIRAVHLGPDERDLLDPQTRAQVCRLLGADAGRHPAALVHFEPRLYPEVQFSNVVRKIGYTIFETDRIPPEWVRRCDHVDEVWVPSQFNRDTFIRSGMDGRKIRIFPYGVDTDFFRPVSETLEIAGRRGFCFLYVFAFDWRKGFDLLVEAYRAEFAGHDDVTLVLKTHSAHHSPEEMKRFILGGSAEGAGVPRVVVLTEPMDLVQLRRLYNTCDLYISTDRANGWGMPCMEAMAMGKPAATIDWSGSTEFMTEANSLLIRPTERLVPVDERLVAARPMYRGHRWAEVRVEEVRRVMRLAYERRDLLARVARRGMADIRERYSHVRAAEQMRDYVVSLTADNRCMGRPDVKLRRPPLTARAFRKASTLGLRLAGRDGHPHPIPVLHRGIPSGAPPRSQSSINGTATGVIWVGPLFHASGYGAVARNCLLGLAQAGVPVKAVDVGEDDRRLLDPRTRAEVSRLLHADAGPRPVGVVHYAPELYPRVRFLHVVKKVGYTLFETDRIPPEWVRQCDHVDEVWLPSRFNQETFAGSGVDVGRIRIFPYGVDTDFFRPVSETLEIAGRRGFCFLYVFPFDWRKGFDVLLEAYRAEFRGEEDVTLILKTQSEHHSAGEMKQLILGEPEARGPLPRVVVLTEPIDLMQLRRLYNSCDLYISTERANGWGMPCMEAMAMGKPAAAIDWGGNTEFMTEENSLLIKSTGRLVPVDDRLVATRPLYRGHRWAEVRVEEVRRVMRLAYQRRDLLARVARRGMQDVRSGYSHVRAAERMRDYLHSLTADPPKRGRPRVWVWRGLGLRRTLRKVSTVLRARASSGRVH